MFKNVLITGATSGIGLATAELLASKPTKFRLIICGRRRERLEAFQRAFPAIECHILSFDITEKAEVFSQIESIPEHFRPIDVLINNAGNAHGLASFENADIQDWDTMLNLNVKGLLYITKAILPDMTSRNSGHIINIGSIAGKEVYPNGNVYCASKFGVDALSAAMRLDLNKYGIKVGQICPGLVETEFSLVRFKGDSQRAKLPYEGYQPLLAQDIAEIIDFMLSRPAHVNVADLMVLPTAQASATVLKKS